ncbi:hypothetical protein ACOMHN_022718 [Nucella lapillus]
MPRKHIKNVNLEKCKTKLHMYNGTVLHPKGKTQLTLTNPKNGNKFKAEFIVVEEDFIPMLGKRTSEAKQAEDLLLWVNVKSQASQSKNPEIKRMMEQVELALQKDAMGPDSELMPTGGRTALFQTLVVCLGAIEGRGGVISVAGCHHVRPRLVLFTDGRPTDETTEVGPDMQSKVDEVGF